MRLIASAAIALVAAGCEPDTGAEAAPGAPPEPSAKPGVPVDRLAPGELAEGKETVFGMPVPRGMKIDRQFVGSAYLVGAVPPEHVANYVRERVEADRVEIGAARTVFPSVRIKGDAARRTYRIEVVADGRATKLVLTDITRPQAEKGLTEAERWRRAGFTPDGKIDPNTLR
jgi:hypothetical protein